jgi:hypothetical protein
MPQRSAAARAEGRYEVHVHCFVSGPRANGAAYKFNHSHEGGETPHQHPETGPASYAIDQDQWARRTGLRGGGRKTFTAKPTGEQLPIQPLEDWQKSFNIIVCEPPPTFVGEGPGLALAERMVQQFGMHVGRVIDGRRR